MYQVLNIEYMCISFLLLMKSDIAIIQTRGVAIPPKKERVQNDGNLIKNQATTLEPL